MFSVSRMPESSIPNMDDLRSKGLTPNLFIQQHERSLCTCVFAGPKPSHETPSRAYASGHA